MKTIAMYLPQYHNVEENNEWWGEGYTDWKAMESAQPLFEGHNQPKRPLNDNKYDLEKKETMQWQANLMKKYGIYGLAIYHYWFKAGRKILERPTENLLRWKDIDIPFCFYWANESWVRSWSAIDNQNVWAARFENNKCADRNDSGILLEQDYGDKDDWVTHYNYCSVFFCDERYIKIQNKPLVMIYKPGSINCLKEMIECWNECAVNDGWDGIYIIAANCDDRSALYVDKQLLQEPGTVISRKFPERYTNSNRMEVARYLSYENVWNEILDYSRDDRNVLYGGFSNYDDTPRRGNAGIVIYNGTVEKFKVYLTDLYAKNAVAGNEYVFINAWNEWGEGMYLEPDSSDKYGYLEAIEYAEKHYKLEMYKYSDGCRKPDNSEITIINRMKRRAEIERRVLDQWMYLKERNINISDYLLREGYKRVAVYGYGMLGKHLLSELLNTEVSVITVIDINSEGLNLDIPVVHPEKSLGNYDLIIVTNIHIYDDICRALRKIYNGTILSLEEIIDREYTNEC